MSCFYIFTSVHGTYIDLMLNCAEEGVETVSQILMNQSV